MGLRREGIVQLGCVLHYRMRTVMPSTLQFVDGMRCRRRRPNGQQSAGHRQCR